VRVLVRAKKVDVLEVGGRDCVALVGYQNLPKDTYPRG
jgi:hypothetical protein